MSGAYPADDQRDGAAAAIRKGLHGTARLPRLLHFPPDAIAGIIAERKSAAAMAQVAQALKPGPVGQEHKPGPGRGKKTGSETTRFDERGSNYLTARIARDRSDILERMKAGEYSPHRQRPRPTLCVNELTQNRLSSDNQCSLGGGRPAPVTRSGQ